MTLGIWAVQYRDGGQDEQKPFGNAAIWWDDDERLVWVVDVDPASPTYEQAKSRPYREDETARVDALMAQQQQDAWGQEWRDRLTAQFTAAADVFAGDSTSASHLRAQAEADITLQAQLSANLQALAGKGKLLSLADLPAVVAALQSLCAWRSVVDQHLVSLHTARGTVGDTLAASTALVADIDQPSATDPEQ